jgi:DUF438 domain-containing protein
MTDKEELKQLLRDLNEQADSNLVRERVAEFIKNSDAQTLSQVEQEIIAEGAISREQLRNLCDVHLDVTADILEQKKSELTKVIPLCILLDEHEVIVKNLEELGEIVSQVIAAHQFVDIGRTLDRLMVIANLLLEAENHYQREEEVLFPRLEKHGVTGPPEEMRREHEELRARKRRLFELIKQAESLGYPEFSGELSEVGNYLVATLKDHIFKEDNILYPATVETLRREEWNEVLKEFEKIGYCHFTPRTHRQ